VQVKTSRLIKARSVLLIAAGVESPDLAALYQHAGEDRGAAVVIVHALPADPLTLAQEGTKADSEAFFLVLRREANGSNAIWAGRSLALGHPCTERAQQS
jgi:hypothetical protein